MNESIQLVNFNDKHLNEEEKSEIDVFIGNLNHDIQRLGLEKEKVVEIVESLYK